MPSFEATWRALRTFVLGSRDYEPEPQPVDDLGRPIPDTFPGTRDFRKRRHEAIRTRRELDRREAKLHDPHHVPIPSAPTRLVIVAPGRRVPWETVVIPDEYTLDEMQRLVMGGRLTQIRWWQEFGRNVIRANARMHAKLELDVISRAKARADRLEQLAAHREWMAEKRYERAVAKEARERRKP